jgi:mxaJ protein
MIALVLFLSAATPALRVCADPNNLPFSNAQAQGFENKLAALIGGELGWPVRYTWWAQRRGFVRNTLAAHRCDVVIGVPANLEMVRTTRPYYRSSYVFVTRRDGPVRIRSFDDPALRTLKIGVPLVGDDGANPPPVYALARRGIIDNVVGFTVYGDYRQDSPPRRMLDALATGEIDLAVVWGPLAGWFARTARVPVRIDRVSPAHEGPLPFSFAIAMAVRKDDEPLQRKLDAILRRRQADIDRLLEAYGIPRLL